MPRPSAERAGLMASLRAWLVTVDGDTRPADDRWTRNALGSGSTPRHRAAASAGGSAEALPPRSRRAHLPPAEQEAAATAERLLTLLERSAPAPSDTPGRRAAERGGGATSAITGDIRRLVT